MQIQVSHILFIMIVGIFKDYVYEYHKITSMKCWLTANRYNKDANLGEAALLTSISSEQRK